MLDKRRSDTFKEINSLLEWHLFEIKHTIDAYEHHYYSDGDDENGHIEYDPEKEELKMYDKDRRLQIELSETNLNCFTVSQYLIQFKGK